MRRVLAALPVWLALALPVTAFDDEDRAGVEQAVADFEAAFDVGNWEAILPPQRLFNVLADLTGNDPDLIRSQSLKQIDEMMSGVEVISYDILTDDMDGDTTESGASYAFMPSVMQISVAGGPARDIESMVVAAEVEEGWHLFRIDSEQQWRLFLRAYPEFEEIARAE